MSASIKSIYIEDFQSHEKSKIELGKPGELTVIVGPTDSGKTAIVRALRLLLYNVPLGNDYIRVGQSQAAVAIEMSDGTKVARERSRGSINRYRVTRPGENPSTFEGFGANVPLEIQEVTGVRTANIGDLKLALNLAEQLDGPFLGNKSISGPARAKVLGKLAGTEEVDQAHKSLGTDIYRADQEEKRLANEIQGLDTKIAEYDYLPTLAENIAAMEGLLKTAKDAQERLSIFGVAWTRLGSIDDQRAQALAVLARWSGLHEAAIIYNQTAALKSTVDMLRQHYNTLLRIAREGEGWIRILSRWVNLPEAGGLVAEASDAQSKASFLSGLRGSLAATESGIERAQTAMKRWVNLGEASEHVYACPDLLTKLSRLENLKTRLQSVKEQAHEIIRIHVRWAGLEGAAEHLGAASDTQTTLSALVGMSDSLTRVRQSQVVAESSLERHRKALGDAQSQYTDTLVALGQCPLCGSEVDPKTLKGVA